MDNLPPSVVTTELGIPPDPFSLHKRSAVLVNIAPTGVLLIPTAVEEGELWCQAFEGHGNPGKSCYILPAGGVAG